ncbi:hypothetical protein [uncultured Thiodictyon sp.]|uniref:hypothetical protein n=1 Tax=uncultured Thiodictyon sp. TaxID=1846217 RepID=UPI0025FF3F04|nr:hypothetical protein [uncultured Thiodictyon sp.]
MTDSEKIFWGAVATVLSAVVVAGIVGLVKLIRGKSEDAVKVAGKLSQGMDLQLLQAVGCPSLVLQVVGRSKRPAKIGRAYLAVRGVNIIPAFERAFGASLAKLPPGRSTRDIVFRMFLPPISKPNHPQGWSLERDETAAFIMPMLAPGLEIAAHCPSEDAWLGVSLIDGTDIEVIRGIEIKNQIEAIFELYGDKPYRLNPDIVIDIQISTISSTPPDTSMIGKTNPKAVELDPDELFNRRPPPSDSEKE